MSMSASTPPAPSPSPASAASASAPPPPPAPAAGPGASPARAPRLTLGVTFILGETAFTLVELLLVGAPLVELATPALRATGLLYRVAPIVMALLVLAGVRAVDSLRPVLVARAAKRAGRAVMPAEIEAAQKAMARAPVEAAVLRWVIWIGAATYVAIRLVARRPARLAVWHRPGDGDDPPGRRGRRAPIDHLAKDPVGRAPRDPAQRRSAARLRRRLPAPAVADGGRAVRRDLRRERRADRRSSPS